MEFNGINNETNGIDGFERRLSERASAIDYWLSEVKSINQLAGGLNGSGMNFCGMKAKKAMKSN